MDIEEIQQGKNSIDASNIEENCEYLTVIRYKKDENISQKILKDYSFDEYRLNYENFFQLFIQSAYLTFACKCNKKQLEIAEEDLRIQEQTGLQKTFSIIIYYTVSEDKGNMNMTISLHRLFEYLVKFEYQYNEKKQGKSSKEELEQKIMKVFRQQYNYIQSNLDNFKKEKEKKFFQCLEELSLFRSFSLLLKIKNKSLLNYLNHNLVKFKTAKKRDHDLTEEAILEKKKIKGDIEQLKKKERLIQQNLVQFFSHMFSGGNYEFKPEANFPDKLKFIIKTKNQEEKSFKERISKVAPELPPYEQMAENSEERKENYDKCSEEYYIEFFPDRNSVSVRFVFNFFNVNIQTSDFLMFLSNIISFQSQNINIQVVDAKEPDPYQMGNHAQTKKYLAFKGSSTFPTKKPFLEKIVTLMDLTMISGLVSESDLDPTKAAFFKLQNYSRFTSISKKINHYTKFYLNISKNIFN